MVKKKGQSKRQSLRVRNDVQKKVREHKRKAKKFANRNPEKAALLKRMRQSQRSEKVIIPSSHPLKDQLLRKVEEAKARREAAVEAKKSARKERRKANALAARLAAKIGGEDMDLSAMVAEAAERAETFDDAEADAEGNPNLDASLGQQSRRAYLRELKKVVNAADVVLHVLDARDPLGSFSVAMEDAIRRHADKKLVLVLNKADLVPKEVLQAWLRHLRRRAPTLAFKASTSEGEPKPKPKPNPNRNQFRGASHLKQMSGDASAASNSVLKSQNSVGAEQLLNLLKNYCRSGGIKSAIAVGVVGYPNVGKSSIINSLKRTRSVGVSATAGYTKVMQEVVLDRNIRLLDCPGVVFADGDAATVALRNVVDPDSLEDPLRPAEAILERLPIAYLQAKYALPSAARNSSTAFFAALGRRLGRVKKGGVPDREAAARSLLRDWNAGRIPFYTTPPAETHSAGLEGEAQILGTFSDGVDVDAMESEDAMFLEALPTVDDAVDMVEARGAPKSGGAATEYELWDEEEEDMEAEGL